MVDAYDAMTTSRPYRAALSAEAAHEELRREVARGWHRRDLVEAFIALPLKSAIRTPVPAPPHRVRAC